MRPEIKVMHKGRTPPELVELFQLALPLLLTLAKPAELATFVCSGADPHLQDVILQILCTFVI